MTHSWKIHGWDERPRCIYCGASDEAEPCRSSLTGGVGRTDRYASAGVADIEAMLGQQEAPPDP